MKLREGSLTALYSVAELHGQNNGAHVTQGHCSVTSNRRQPCLVSAAAAAMLLATETSHRFMSIKSFKNSTSHVFITTLSCITPQYNELGLLKYSPLSALISRFSPNQSSTCGFCQS